MRFSAPRSVSPSPVRRSKPKKKTSTVKTRRSPNSFGLNVDSDSGSDSDTSVASSSSSDSFCYASESEVPKPTPKQRSRRITKAEEYYIEDTVASIRLRVHHHDAYEEWERETRRDAFRTARVEHNKDLRNLRSSQLQLHSQDAARLDDILAKQLEDVQARLDSMKIRQETEEQRLRKEWAQRDKLQTERIESVIKMEEEKARRKMEEEREKERRRKEEELKRLAQEEKHKREEEEKKKKAEEEQRRKEEEAKKEEEERQRIEEEQKQRAEAVKAQEEQRKALGMTTPEDDWLTARRILQEVKEGSMKVVKQNREMKSAWGACRRQITPKIGQLTHDAATIDRVSHQIYEVIVTNPVHPPEIYTALLSSLSKSIILQAETEVTAEKRSAGPISDVAFNLLGVLQGFPEVFFAKLVQRVGGWPVPLCTLPINNVQDQDERMKLRGFRKNDEGTGWENAEERIQRVAGIMRVYFGILKRTDKPLGKMFQTPRYWAWFSRLLSERASWDEAMTAELIFTALDVMGAEAVKLWGRQFVKILEIVYRGVKEGYAEGKYLGGSTPEGKAARVRVQLEIDRIMNS